MTFAAILIFMFEFVAIKKLEQKYYRNGETDLDPIEFVSRATLDDIIKYRYHINNTWLSMGIMSIGSIVKL